MASLKRNLAKTELKKEKETNSTFKKETIPILTKVQTPPSLFYEANIILITKPNKDMTNKNVRTTVLINSDINILWKTFKKPNPVIYKKNNTAQ